MELATEVTFRVLLEDGRRVNHNFPEGTHVEVVRDVPAHLKSCYERHGERNIKVVPGLLGGEVRIIEVDMLRDRTVHVGQG